MSWSANQSRCWVSLVNLTYGRFAIALERLYAELQDKTGEDLDEEDEVSDRTEVVYN